MTSNKSVFRYKIIDNHKSPKEIIEQISEELNRGLTFIVSQTEEKVVTLSGEWKGWVTTAIRGNNIYIYVDDNFFTDCCILEQILTSLWANLLDFGEILLEDFQLSDNIHNLLTCRNLNKLSIQKSLKIKGPYFGTVFKPSFGLSLPEKIDVAKKFAALGGAFIKEDETYLVDKQKLIDESKAIQKAMSSLSNHCFYVPNVTPHLPDEYLFQELYDTGIRVVMVNYLITGLPIFYKIIKSYKKILFWGHRIGYKSIEKYLSMNAMTILVAYCGINLIHIGTPLFSMADSVKKGKGILNNIRRVDAKATPVFTKTSSQIVPKIIKSFGKNVIIMACGAIRTNGYLDWGLTERWIKIEREVK